MLLALTALLAFPQASTNPPDVYRLVRVEASELAGRPRLLPQLGFDHVGHDATSGAVELAADGEQLAALDAQGVDYEIVIDDLATWYASRLSAGPELPPQFGAWLSPAFASGAMGGYYTFSQVTSVLDQIHAAYPATTTAKASIGTTLEGRTLWMLKLSDNAGVDENEPEVRIDSLHHAREPEGMQASLWFMLFLLEGYGTDPLATYLVDHRELYFVPVVNPDGYVYNQTTNPSGGGMWRKNRRNNGGSFGVDLNRNYANHWGWDDTGSSPSGSSETYRGPSPASELEIQAMQAFSLSRQFGSALSIHTYSNLWLYPYGYAQVYPSNNAQYVEVSTLATEINHYEVGPPAFILYTANGVSCDWEHDAKGTLAWSPEIGSNSDGFWPPTARIVPLADENLLALQRTALTAGAWMRVLSKTTTEVGDGDGYFEPGESVNVAATVRNSGRAASTTGVALTLTSSNPYVTVVNGTHDFGSPAGFTQATSPALSFAIAANAPSGVAIDYTLTLTYEGWSQTEVGSVPVGQPIPFVIDDAEIDWGWTKGVAGDTATTGVWTRGSPIGTTSSGQPASPSQDNTPTPGVQCYLTGNGGGSAGTDDVDNGATTLLSPIFDLSNCGPARLSYARWFADLTVADDTLAISISNNGGQSWTPLESITGNNNAWSTVAFDVPSFVAQTANMRLRFVAADTSSGSVVEGAIDDLKLVIYDAVPKLNLYGKSTAGTTVLANLTGPAGATYALRATITDPNVGGSPPALAAHARTIASGTIPASRLASIAVTLPSGASWVGHKLWYRGVLAVGASKQLSNWASVTVQ